MKTNFCKIFTLFAFFSLLILQGCGDSESTQSPQEEFIEDTSRSDESYDSSSSSSTSEDTNTIISSSSFLEKKVSSSSEIASLASSTSEETCIEKKFAGKWEFLSKFFTCDSVVVNGVDSTWYGQGRADYDYGDESFVKSLCNSDDPEILAYCYAELFDSDVEEALVNMEFHWKSSTQEYVSSKEGFEIYSLLYSVHQWKSAQYEFSIKILNKRLVESSSSGEESSSSYSSSSSFVSSSSQSSSSMPESSSSVSSSSSQNSSSSSALSSSSELSSSSFFVIPDSLVNHPYLLTLAEIKETIKESMYGSLFATDSFQIRYSMSGRVKSMNFGSSYTFISKGKDKLYYEQSLDTDYLKNTRTIINGERKKVIFLDDRSSRLSTVTQEYIDSVRIEFSQRMLFKNPLDSGVWQEPEQITDSIYRVRSDAGAELYYNSASKKCEMWTENLIVEGNPTDYEYRYEYVDGFVKSQMMNAVTHSSAAGDVSVSLTVTLSSAKTSADFSDRLFEF